MVDWPAFMAITAVVDLVLIGVMEVLDLSVVGSVAMLGWVNLVVGMVVTMQDSGAMEAPLHSVTLVALDHMEVLMDLMLVGT
uniref:Uncharacterized protein n=1 Tax=Arundo donax TaxID=35708 RepID=A0A0A9GG60_ARUDO